MLMRKQVAVLMEQGRVRLHSLVRAFYGRERLVLHVYERLGLLHYHGLLRHNKGYRVAKVPCALTHGYHSVPILFKMAHLVLPGYIGGCKHGYDARQGFCP